MGARSKYILESFAAELSKNLDGFSALPVKHRFYFAWHIFEHGIKSRAHHVYEGYMSINTIQLRREFGDGIFNLLNNDLDIFEVLTWRMPKNGIHGYTKGYKPTHKVQMIKDKYLISTHTKPSRLLYENGRVMRKIPRAILSQNTKSQMDEVWKGAVIKNSVKVDIPALVRLQKKVKAKIKNAPLVDIFMTKDEAKKIEKAAAKMQRVLDGAGKALKLARTVPDEGMMPHQYQTSPSGRLYGLGTSLQNLPRAVRGAALNGANLYDIENCHYSILAQLAARHEFRCENINHYLTHKKEVRQKIADEIGLEINDIKMALMALVYGAPASSSPYCSITKEFGSISKTKHFLSVPLVMGINAELKEARSIILDGWEQNRGKISNALGKKMDASEKPKILLAHILQGIEAKALRKVAELYPDSIELAMHDGFITRDEISIPLIEAAIYESTGFNLKWSFDFVVEIEP